jgi:hypothetical protein
MNASCAERGGGGLLAFDFRCIPVDERKLRGSAPVPIWGEKRPQTPRRQLGKPRRRHDGEVDDLASHEHRSRHTVLWALVLGVAGGFIALALPIHVTAGSGSIRCADSFFAGGLHYEGTACDAAARDRLADAGLLGVGLVVAVGAVGLRRRPSRIVGLLGGGLIALVGLLAVVQNLVG